MMRLSQGHWVPLCCNICPSSSKLSLKSTVHSKTTRTPQSRTSSSVQLSLAEPHWLDNFRISKALPCIRLDQKKQRRVHITSSNASISISAPPLQAGLRESAYWVWPGSSFFSRLSFGWALAFLWELSWGAVQGLGGFIVSSRCWSSQDGWARLESDTYSQLSHRAPLYIDPYYQGQIAIALAVCLGTGGKNGVYRAHCITRTLSTWLLCMRLYLTFRV